MKIFSAAQIKAWDAYTIKNEPISSVDLMERASLAFTNWFVENYDKNEHPAIFCGIGNNGGDGLAIARLLLERGYLAKIYVVRFATKTSQDFDINYERLKKIAEVIELKDEVDIPNLSAFSVVIDGIFGSGLSRQATGVALGVIRRINESINKEIISIDIASGLFCDAHTAEIEKVIHPTHTVSFQTPKLSFLLPENAIAVGKWHTLPIGLHPKYYAETSSQYEFTDFELIKKVYQPRTKFSHKGTFGHALLLAGSYGKIGAAVLSTKAILSSGAGLLTTYLPQCGYTVMQSSVPEAMCLTDENKTIITQIPSTKKYKAIGIGPGIGQEKPTFEAIKALLHRPNLPRLLLDADAINIIAQNRALVEKTPKNSIFTPHPKEFERLAGKTANHFERLEALKNFCQNHKVYLVLKGAHSAIGTPKGKIYFNSTGNAGMAAAGSGDVLTGIITGLLSQPYSVKDAVLLGVFLHGLAGDLALENQSEESLMASEITNNLGKAFNHIKNENSIEIKY